MIRKMINSSWLIGGLCLALVACSEQESWEEAPMTAEQQAMIGRAVNFDASFAEPFATRATSNRDGSFNQDDRMVIYRQYYNPEKRAFDEDTEAFRTYKFDYSYATNTSIFLGNGWKVDPGRKGSNGRENGNPKTFVQTANDSLTWENGTTVRFRAWALSNLYGCLRGGDWSSYYPDFSVSDWVTASGPTLQIPLYLKHVGCRICIRPRSGNVIQKIEISTDEADYRREDNAGSSTDDANDKSPETSSSEDPSVLIAQQKAENVKAVYNRMCWPGGVDFNNGLKALTKEYVNDNVNYATIEEDAAQMIAFGDKTPDDIESLAQRPQFNSNNGYYYMVTIPYDMSNGAQSGQSITLPPYTRFRVWLRDVNNGDKSGTGQQESTYHLFCLNDIVQVDEETHTETPAFPDGLTLRGGYSYDFLVGYHYKTLKVTTDNNFSWTDNNDVADGSASDVSPDVPEGTNYAWWKKGLDDAIAAALAPSSSGERKAYEPEFELSDLKEVCEFIRLVNGTAATKTTGLARARRSETNSDNGSKYWWYRTLFESADTTWVTKEQAEAEGYVFYNKYVPSNGDVAAYSIEELLDAPFSFYDSSVQKRLKVTITAPIDFQDVPMEGMSQPFCGYLDGGMKSLTNLNLTNGYLFENLTNAVVTNLSIDTWRSLGLVNEATNSVLAGISIKASPCKSLAQKMTGTCYVVGCIMQGENGEALVGTADNLTMMGCMQTVSGLGGGGALLASYATGAGEFFAPQTAEKVGWGRLMCCYYDVTRSPQARAVGGKDYSYKPQQYVRGQYTCYLCALEDHLLNDKSYYSKLSGGELMYYYGLAPYKAMNSAIYYYNKLSTGKAYPCKAHFEVHSAGYNHRYPQLLSGAPTAGDYVNVTEQNN